MYSAIAARSSALSCDVLRILLAVQFVIGVEIVHRFFLGPAMGIPGVREIYSRHGFETLALNLRRSQRHRPRAVQNRGINRPLRQSSSMSIQFLSPSRSHSGV